MTRLARPLISAFEALQRTWEGPRQPRAAGTVPTAAFLVALAAIEANRQGLLPAGVASAMPRKHSRAVDLAFTLLLLFEVIGVLFRNCWIRRGDPVPAPGADRGAPGHRRRAIAGACGDTGSRRARGRLAVRAG